MTEQSHSGELLLASLVAFLDQKENDIVRGRVAVRLHPRALEYLASRLHVLQELDRLRQSSPVEFFRGAFADVDDYTHLQKLHHLLAITKRLCILPTVHHLRDPTRVNLLAFKSLVQLELRNCDLSTSAWLGFANVSSTLQSLTCIGSLEELRHLLAPYSSAYALIGDKEARPDTSCPWPKLTQLVCKQNSLVEMDHTLALPSLRKLDLCSNNISSIQNIYACSQLTELNLSHNCIESLLPLSEGPFSLAKLVLQGNALKNMHGVSRLSGLTELDLRCNILASYHEFRELQGLDQLELLYLEGNPLAYAPFYRLDVLSWAPSPLLKLDGVITQKEEREAAGLRVAGQIPLAWQIMSEFVGQRELLWRPPKRDRPRPSPMWRAGSSRPSPAHMPSPSRHRPLSARRCVPARRIVEFSGDPLAVLEESLERPASPSPFHPAREDLLETLSQSSTASAKPSRNSQWSRGNVQTIYRDRSETGGVSRHTSFTTPKPSTHTKPALDSTPPLPLLLKDSSSSSVKIEDSAWRRDDSSESSSLYTSASSAPELQSFGSAQSRALEEALLEHPGGPPL